MTDSDPMPGSRRALRESSRRRGDRSEQQPATSPSPTVSASSTDETEVDLLTTLAGGSGDALGDAEQASRVRSALAWVDEESLAPTYGAHDFSTATSPYVPASADLLAHRPRRSLLRPGVVTPIITVLAVVVAYVGATLLWPLYAVTPVAKPAAIATVSSAASTVTWPDDGSAAVGVAGIDATAASTDEADSMASITKVVTMLMVLEQHPLEVGESGPTYTMTYDDRRTYLDYYYRGESSLPVRTGTELTMLQLIQGALLGSAGNFVDYLASLYWPTDSVFASAAADWLDRHGIDGMTIVEPTGIDHDNVATPEALVTLARKALQNDVIADVVKTASVELPVAGTVENTNPLIGDDGVIGLKTGTLTGHYNLLAAKEITVDGTTVRLYLSVIGQPTAAARASESERMLDELAVEVSVPAVLPAGTLVGTVTTAWGDEADIVTDEDAQVILWNGATGSPDATLSLGDARTAGASVGTLTLTGPLNEASVGVHLDGDIADPDGWWRLTHPLELLGLVG